MDRLRQLVKNLVRWGVVVWVVVIAFSTLGGYYLSRTLVPKPKVGVIHYVGTIGSIDVAWTRAWFDYMRRHPEIRALAHHQQRRRRREFGAGGLLPGAGYAP